MNKISAYIIVFFLAINCSTTIAQNNKTSAITSNEQGSDIFYHTIERGETVYAIATMYGVKAEDIYRLNPDSREGIKVGFKLKIPQLDSTTRNGAKETATYSFHTIKAKETLFSVSRLYKVPANQIVEANPGLAAETFTTGKNIRIPLNPYEVAPVESIKTVTKDVPYTIEKKETLYRIGKKFNITSAELIKRNPSLKEGVKAGKVIYIPVNEQQKVLVSSEATDEKEVNALLSRRKEAKKLPVVKVSLLLPFMTEEAYPSSNTSRFIEYYEGFLLAVDSLRSQGCSIDLSVFDTGNGTDKINDILKNAEVKNADLLIGAVQNDQIHPISEFAEKNKIRYVIPFTSKNDDVLSNAYVFQVNTPHSYLYSKAAQAGYELFKNYNIVLLNTNDSQDDKKDFIKALKAELKQNKISYKECTYNPATFSADIEKQLSKEKQNVIIPMSGSLETLNKIKNPLVTIAKNKSEYELTLFGYPEWQTYTRDCLEEFYALNTYIYSNFYADNLNSDVQDFYHKYKTWYSKNLINTFPKYGMLGFDTGMYFFKAMCFYGSNFENNLKRTDYQSIQTGFHFERVNNWGGFINTNLFIVHYNKDFTITRLQLNEL